MARIVVIGAGVAGLGVALCAARSEHHVTLIERDDTPLPTDAHGAFEWDRRGAPQVRHSHAFLARLRNLLRDRHPDVLAALLDAGATEMRFTEMAPDGLVLTPEPGDDDLVGMACRRTTFEWVLRRIVLSERNVTLLHGTPVAALITTSATEPDRSARRSSTSSGSDSSDASGGGDGRTCGPESVGSDSSGTTGRPGERDSAERGATRGSPATSLREPPVVSGVELADGSVVDADVVVDAGGRRADVPGLLARIGVQIDESADDTGIIYLSRFFRLRNGADLPPRSGVIGGDVGYLKYGVFPGDNRTFSITFAVGTHDTELRKLLIDPDAFLDAAATFDATAPFVDGRAEPITDVELMGGLINRRRVFTSEPDDSTSGIDATPLVLGFHAVGDAHTATNPLYGRGCSLATVQAQMLVDLLDEHGADSIEAHRARAMAYEAGTTAEVTPWYRAAVAQDRLARSAGAHTSPTDNTLPGTEPADADATAGSQDAAPFVDPSEFVRSLLRDGLLPAMRVDPVVLRAFLRMFNLLTPPDSLMNDADVISRVMAVYQDRDNRPPEPALGPDRDGFLSELADRRRSPTADAAPS